MNKFKLLIIIALATGTLQGANASVIATLTFVDPTGTVSADESIEVWVRLTLDSLSDPFTYNPFDAFPNGVNVDDIPTHAVNSMGNLVPFGTYDSIFQSLGRVCNDTFTVDCNGPGSAYSYNIPPTDGWFDFDGTINPGESFDFLLFTLDPIGGVAAAGNYELYFVSMSLAVQGADESGEFLAGVIYLFRTDCLDANCTFRRTVTAVPVPAAVWLFGSALIGIAGLSRRK